MAIKNIEEIKFEEIEPRIHTRREYDNAGCFHDYDNYEPLREVYNLSKMIVPKNKDSEGLDWYIVNIFGYEYTHGYLFNMPECGEDYYGLSYEEELYNHYKVRYPRQREHYLEPIKKRYLNEEIIAQLLAFNIDPAKFWYALLWLMQYVNEMSKSAMRYRSASECIEDFIDSVSKEERRCMKNFLKKNHKPILNIKFETHDRKGKNVLEISNPLVANIIKNNLLKCMCEVKEALNLSDKKKLTKEERVVIDNKLQEKAHYYFIDEEKVIHRKHEKLYLFRKFLTPYLNERPKEKYKIVKDFIKDYPNKEIKAPVNKDILIARLLWVIGYIPEEDLGKWNNKDALRVYLKSYEGLNLENKDSITYGENALP